MSTDTPRPTASCGCGYDLVWINGQWEHDAAPSLWGGDHDPDAGEPDDMEARKFWDNHDLGEPAKSTPVLKVPPFQMDVQGEYQGNPFPEPAEYRIHMIEGDDETVILSVENSSGGEVKTQVLSAEEVEGVMEMAHIDHGLGAYEDDWTIPAGIDRKLTWDLGAYNDYVVIESGQIDEMRDWLEYVVGDAEWTGGDTWEER